MPLPPDVARLEPAQLWIAAGVVALDQATKAWIRRLLDLHESVTVIPGVLDLTRVHNTGVAFGFLDNADFPLKPLILALLPIAALVGLTYYSATLEATQRLTRLGLSFVIGGAAGNLVDRLTAGYVLDFIDVYRGDWHFWAFNVADAAINVGVGLMIVDLLGLRRTIAATPGRAPAKDA